MNETVVKRIEEHTRRYAGLPLFEAFRHDSIPVERFGDFFHEQYLAARGFQDLIWAGTEIPDGPYAAAAREHRRRDSGHYRWLEKDLTDLGLPPCDVDGLYQFERLPTRIQLARILARCWEAGSLEKIVILLCLESAGAVTLGTLYEYVRRNDLESKTRYLGKEHVQLEDGQVDRLLDSAPELRQCMDPRLLDTVDLVFDALTRMFTDGGHRYYGTYLASQAAEVT